MNKTLNVLMVGMPIIGFVISAIAANIPAMCWAAVATVNAIGWNAMERRYQSLFSSVAGVYK